MLITPSNWLEKLVRDHALELAKHIERYVDYLD